MLLTDGLSELKWSNCEQTGVLCPLPCGLAKKPEQQNMSRCWLERQAGRRICVTDPKLSDYEFTNVLLAALGRNN